MVDQICNKSNNSVDMKTELNKIFIKFKIKYIPCLKTSNIENVHNLFKNGTMYNSNDAEDYVYIGLYYRYIKEFFNKAIKSFLSAIEIASVNTKSISYINLARSYELMNYHPNYNERMFLTGFYTDQNIKRLNKANKYYLLAIKIDKYNNIAMYKLAKHYNHYGCEEDFGTNDIKYFLMAAKNHHKKTIIGFINSEWFPLKEIINIEWFEIFIENQEILKLDDIYNALLLLVGKDLNKEEKIKLTKLISRIKTKDNEKMPFLLESLINLIKYNVDMMELDLKYSSNGLNYEDAKKDFISNLVKHNLDKFIY